MRNPSSQLDVLACLGLAKSLKVYIFLDFAFHIKKVLDSVQEAGGYNTLFLFLRMFLKFH